MKNHLGGEKVGKCKSLVKMYLLQITLPAEKQLPDFQVVIKPYIKIPLNILVGIIN